MPDLATTLELLAERGARELYEGELARKLVDHVRGSGGLITEEDLRAYRVIRRRPVHATYRGHDFCSNPPPSSGGVLIAYALRLLDQAGEGGEPGSAAAMARVAQVLREVARARDGGFGRALVRGGVKQQLEQLEPAALERVRAGAPGVAEGATARGTTHISAVDAAGDAASLTVSTGSGSGVVVPRTGIGLNNMIGEFDLPREPRPGLRLSSMMSPSLVSRPDGSPRLVLGSAGSLRLRSAVLQVVVNVVGHGLPVAEAIARPRMHAEEPVVHCEGSHDAAEVDALAAMGYDVVRWRGRNLYFGGAAVVGLREDGSLEAAGDPRRGGAGVVVK
jgi:gamma-glutamyltranspeptidase/glutathione hydrolase